MFGRLFKRETPRPAAVPEGVTAYAIGDIHGRADLLEALLDQVLLEAAETDRGDCVMVFLGDYIDRGPASPKVLDMLLNCQRLPGFEWRFLRGNHEQALLDFIEDPVEAGPSWGAFGGRETLQSYGVEAPFGSDARLWRQARDSLEARMPREHRAFLAAMPASFELGDYFFVHAGARPGVPLDRQDETDLMRIRKSFLEHGKAFEKVIVHGHSIVAEVHCDHRRIGIDTGAYASGALTALKLEGEGRSLLQTRQADGRIEVVRREVGADT